MAESKSNSNTTSGPKAKSPSASPQPAKFTPSKNVTPITTGADADKPKSVPAKVATPAVKKEEAKTKAKPAAKKKAPPKKAAPKKAAAKKPAAKKKAAPKKAAKKKAAPKKAAAKKVAKTTTKAANTAAKSFATIANANDPFATVNDAAKNAYKEAGKWNEAAFSGYEKWSAKASKQISEATKEQTRLIDACMKCKNMQDIAKVQAEIASTALEYQMNGFKESAELFAQLSKQQSEIAAKLFSGLSK